MMMMMMMMMMMRDATQQRAWNISIITRLWWLAAPALNKVTSYLYANHFKSPTRLEERTQDSNCVGECDRWKLRWIDDGRLSVLPLFLPFHSMVGPGSDSCIQAQRRMGQLGCFYIKSLQLPFTHKILSSQLLHCTLLLAVYVPSLRCVHAGEAIQRRSGIASFCCGIRQTQHSWHASHSLLFYPSQFNTVTQYLSKHILQGKRGSYKESHYVCASIDQIQHQTCGQLVALPLR